MKINYVGSEFEVPDLLVNTYLKDFDGLPGGKYREGVYRIRHSISDILDMVSEEPDILEEPEYRLDFVNALAMRQAMNQLGILYDS